VLSNCEWRQGKISAAYRQPFDLLAETVAGTGSEMPCGTNLSTGRTGWLGFLEAYRTFWLTPAPEIGVLMREAGILGGTMKGAFGGS
jgi:hypothetical protein